MKCLANDTVSEERGIRECVRARVTLIVTIKSWELIAKAVCLQMDGRNVVEIQNIRT